MLLEMMRKILCLIVLTLCSIPCANAESRDTGETTTLKDIYRDWDSVVNDAQSSLDTGFISEQDWRETILFESDLMHKSKLYAEMELQVSSVVGQASYIIRCSQRYLTEFHTPPDTILMRGDTMVPIYPEPEIGIITWIVGTEDGMMHLFYREERETGKIVHRIKKGCTLPFEQLKSNSYLYFGNPSYHNIVSIWTPSVKRHLFVNGLRRAAIVEPDEASAPGARTLRTIAMIVTEHKCD